jgi:hypothetical protein
MPQSHAHFIRSLRGNERQSTSHNLFSGRSNSTIMVLIANPKIQAVLHDILMGAKKILEFEMPHWIFN